jgi:hypothetical protein
MASKQEELCFIIGQVGIDETLYWSNEHGWADRESATVFSGSPEGYHLPIDATFVSGVLPESRDEQSLRLL